MSHAFPDPVVLAEFSQRVEAELFSSVLKAAGINAMIQSDDCGTVDPALAFGLGVKIFVDLQDIEKAKELMKSVNEPSE